MKITKGDLVSHEVIKKDLNKFMRDLRKPPKTLREKWQRYYWRPFKRYLKDQYWWFYNLPHRIRTFWWYAPVLMKDFDWSSHFLIHLIERKLERMEKFNRYDSMAATHMTDVKEIRTVLKLIKKGHKASMSARFNWDEWKYYKQALEYMIPKMANWGD